MRRTLMDVSDADPALTGLCACLFRPTSRDFTAPTRDVSRDGDRPVEGKSRLRIRYSSSQYIK
jgi:hypothetical protein